MTGLGSIGGVTVYGQGVEIPRGSVVSFTMDGLDPSKVGFLLDNEYEISVRTGLHCAPKAHQSIGTYPSGTIRVSPGWFNTGEEIALLLEALEQITGRK